MSNVKSDSRMKEVGVQKSRRVEGNTIKRQRDKKQKSGIWTCFLVFFFG